MTGRVRLAAIDDCEALAQMRTELWPDGPIEEHRAELSAILSGTTTPNGATTVFVWENEGGELKGFLEARLRSHADGCDEARPVGYLEGWFVSKDTRRRGVGTALMKAAEHWARAQGCKQMASDAEIHNEISQQAHQALGFEPTSRVVTHRKLL